MSTPTVPYAPSWVDRLTDRIDALPVAPWVVYLVAFLSVAAISNAIGWAEGYVAPGTVDLYFSQNAVFLVLGYGAIHYLDHVASRAWSTFRPLVSLGDEDAGRLAYELTTMPVRPILVCALLGVVTAVTYFAIQYGRPFDLANGPITFVVGLPFTCVVFTGTWALVYHSFHQLQVIGRLHRYVASVDLLHLERLHAFASVTAATGVALLLLGYAGLPATPDALSNPQQIAWAGFTTAAAVVAFVRPLYGIRNLISAEKSRRLEAVNALLDRALADLHRRGEEGDFSDADMLNDHISSLLAERDVMARTPTWPWSLETLRGFTAAIVLPIGLWLVYRFLGQVLT